MAKPKYDADTEPTPSAEALTEFEAAIAKAVNESMSSVTETVTSAMDKLQARIADISEHRLKTQTSGQDVNVDEGMASSNLRSTLIAEAQFGQNITNLAAIGAQVALGIGPYVERLGAQSATNSRVIHGHAHPLGKSR